MRDLFRGYYKPTPAEFAEIWKTCIFSFDANVLLHVYSYTPETRERFFEILKGLSDRIWIPHQVAYEYQRNRLYVISNQIKAYDDIELILNKNFDNLKNELFKDYKRHPFLNTKSIVEYIDKVLGNVKSQIKLAQLNHPDYIEFDELREELTNLLDGKVGKPYTEEELEKIYQKAEKRFSYKQPPGYKDAKKPVPRNYGDVVLWFQLIDYAKWQQKPILFVTDDDKEDWWLKYGGESIEPRPDLIQEIVSEVGLENFQFYIYHSDKFIDYAEKFLNLPTQPEAVEEAREIMLQDSGTKRIIVESNYLRSVGYDYSTQVLEIEFRGGDIYRYLDVPPSVYTDLMNASSHGKYFNANIKEVYTYHKLN
ncbi:MAG TPA: PIN-like domain-containing protein [Coleofasciculaceae cyanobacterium]